MCSGSKKQDSQRLFIVIGDSHSIIWEGNLARSRGRQQKYPTVRVHHIGPALAYNLMSTDGSFGKWGERIYSILEEYLSAGLEIDAVMLCFGEIDIRTQVIKRAALNNNSIQDEVEKIVYRVLSCAQILRAKVNAPIFIFEPIPTMISHQGSWTPDFPAVGSERERNYATVRFSATMRDALSGVDCAYGGIYSFGIALQAMTNFHTKQCFYDDDGVHLNYTGLELAIESLSVLCAENGLKCAAAFAPNIEVSDIKIEEEFLYPTRISPSTEKYRTTSVLNPRQENFFFHTERENGAHIIIDLGFSVLLSKLEIYNRVDAHQQRARSISVELGNDISDLSRLEGVKWEDVFEPLLVLISPQHISPCRFIKLQLNENTFFHLSRIKIFVLQFEKANNYTQI